MNLYRNIKNTELPALLRAAYEENNNNIEEASKDLELIDQALGLFRMRSLINARSRKAKKNRWSTNRNFRGILENLILKKSNYGKEKRNNCNKQG